MTTTNTQDTLNNTSVQSVPVPSVSAAVSVDGETTHVSNTGAALVDSRGAHTPGDVFLTDVLVKKIPISSTDSPDVNLTVTDFNVWKTYLLNPLIASRLTGFGFLQADLQVTVVMTCPGSCLGAYAVGFLCEGGGSSGIGFDNDQCDTPFTVVQHDHVILNCERQGSGTLRLPFVYPLSALPTDGGTINKPMWRMIVYPLSPLTSTVSSGTQGGTISVYARMCPGYTLQTRCYESGVISSTVGAFSRAAGELTRVPVIGSFASAAASGLAAASSIADALGFTRESSPRMPEPYTMKYASSMATVDGTDPSNPLALFSDNAVTIDPTQVGGSSDDVMSFGDLCSRWTLIRYMNVSMSTPPGVVGSIAVTPYHMCTEAGIGEGDLSMLLTATAYVGLPFSYWSGSMDFRIYIPSAANVQGRLQVFWEPFCATDLDGANDPTVYNEGCMINLSGSSDTIIRVSMAPPSPVRSSRFTTTGDATSGDLDNSCNGKLVFFLTSTLTSPLTSLTLPIIVMARGGPDLAFHQPRNFISNRPISECINFTYEGKDDGSVDQAFHHFSKGPSYPISALLFGEEVKSARALVQKFAPYVAIGVNPSKAEAVGAIGNFVCLPLPPLGPKYDHAFDQISCVPPSSIVTSTYYRYPNDDSPYPSSNPSWTWQAHYSMLFTGVRGSTRVKIFPRKLDTSVSGTTASDIASFGVLGLNDQGAVMYINSLHENSEGKMYEPAGDNFGIIHYDIPMISVNTGAGELTIPYYSPYKFVNPRTMDYNPGPGNIFSVGTPNALTASGLYCYVRPRLDVAYSAALERQYDVHVAASSDYTAVQFRRVPKIAVRQYYPVGP